jgi:acid phosphatase
MVACAERGKHKEGDETLCTLEAFAEAVENVRPVNWRKECETIGMSSFGGVNF